MIKKPLIPAACNPSTICRRIGFPRTLIIGFGSSAVSSRIRVPRPAARRTALSILAMRKITKVLRQEKVVKHRWWQFGSAMRVFNFHSHLDWWGFLGALAGCIGGIFIMLGFAFRIGILLAFLVALVNAIAVAHHEHGLYPIIIPIEAVIVLVCLSFIGPGKYSVDKS